MFWIWVGGLILLYCLTVRVRLGKLRSLRIVIAGGIGSLLLGGLILCFPGQLFVWILQLIALILITFLLAAEVSVLSGAYKGRAAADASLSTAPCATIVLGCGLKNGKRISTTLTERLLLAKKVNAGEPIVLSGGRTPHEYTEEACVMAEWMKADGVPEHLLLLEARSRNTAENLLFSMELLQKARIDCSRPIRIITSDFHCGRVEKLAHECGYKNAVVCGSKTMPLIAPVYHVRECLSIFKRELYRLKKNRQTPEKETERKENGHDAGQ